MHSNAYLFPVRQSRRDFLRVGAKSAAGIWVTGLTNSCASRKPAPPSARIGSGRHTFEAVDGWGRLPNDLNYGFGCGIAVDSRDNVYVTSRSTQPCVAIFDRHGRLLETWSNDFGEKIGLNTARIKDTAHGLYWSRERDGEFFYWTENSPAAKADQNTPGIGRRVYKTDLRGKILYEIGNVAREGSTAQRFDWTNPTDVAVAPNGDIYVVDGYGSQRVSRFDKNFRHLRTIGGRSSKPGPEAEPGTFNTCHGVWVNTLRRSGPELYIADRHNDRLQVFDLELNFKRIIKGVVRNPCCFYQHKDCLYIPDLASRVTILDADDQLIAHLGDGKGAADNRTNPALFAAPHALCVDSRGALYTVEWLDFGRPRKFRPAPQPA